MYSNIQSYHKKLTTKLWRNQEAKRRNSSSNTKKEETDTIYQQINLNYDITEEKSFLDEFLSTKQTYDYMVSSVNLPQLELLSKLRPIRTLKLSSAIDSIEKNNSRLETFILSYTKDFVFLKSKHDVSNRQHLFVNLIDYSNTESPIYEVDQELSETTSPDEMFQLWKNQSLNSIQSDPLITGLLNTLSAEADEIQSVKLRRRNRENKLFPLYGPQDPDKLIELRPDSEFPIEFVGKSFKVELLTFRLEPDMEPIFGELCCYDLKNKRRISENFYFDFNSHHKLKMFDEANQTDFIDRLTPPRSCIFHVSQASDIFLIIRVEKTVQQGDVNEIADFYLRDEKHKSKLRTQIEWSCKNLAKYRMPFGIIALELGKLMNTTNSNTNRSVSNINYQSSNSIDNSSITSRNSSVKVSKTPSNQPAANRKSHLDSSMKSTSRSLSKDINMVSTATLEEEEFDSSYNNMLMSETVINHLYRQDNDRISDEDLFKWLQDCCLSNNATTTTTSNTSATNIGGASSISGSAVSGGAGGGSNQKRMKTISCHIDLQISPINEMVIGQQVINPEHLPLANYFHQSPSSTNNAPVGTSTTNNSGAGTGNNSARTGPTTIFNASTQVTSSHVNETPIIDLLEFPSTKRFYPYNIYRNLLYVYPKSVNFSSRSNNFRNITIKIELLHSDGEKMKLLKLIYNKSFASKFTSEAFTKILYHNKNPSFNDEIKIQLPSIVTPSYLLMFTFYHVSCQPNKKTENNAVEQIVGYSWLPLMDRNIMKKSEHALMISLDRPSPGYALKKPDTQTYMENIRWLDNSKELFRVYLHPVSTVHSEDCTIERFNNIVSYVRQIVKNNTKIEDCEDLMLNLLTHSNALEKCNLESLIQYSYVILDNLLWLSFGLTTAQCDSIQLDNEVKKRFLYSIGCLVSRVTSQLANKYPNLNRNSYLQTYAMYAANFPNIHVDEEFIRKYINYQINIETNKNTPNNEAYLPSTIDESVFQYLFHEELLVRIVSCMEMESYEVVFDNVWFFLDLLIRAMKEFHERTLSLRHTRKCHQLFSDRFLNNILRLIYLSIQYVDKKLHNISSACSTATSGQTFHQCQYLIRNLALFFNDLILLFDVPFIRTMVINFVGYINGRLEAEKNTIVRLFVLLKLEFLRIMTCTEYFLYINNFDTVSQRKCDDTFGNVMIGQINPFFIGLLFKEMKICLRSNDAEIQYSVGCLIWNLLASHENDSRYTDDINIISQIAELYLPYINVLFDSIKYIRTATCISNNTSAKYSNKIDKNSNSSTSNCSHDNCSVSSMDAGSSNNINLLDTDNLLANMTGDDEADCDDNDDGGGSGVTTDIEKLSNITNGGCKTDRSNCKHLLLSFIWLLKNLNSHQLNQYLSVLSPYRINRLLHLLLLSAINFEYKGSKENKWKRKPESSRSSIVDLTSSIDHRRDPNQPSRISNSNFLFGKLCMEVIFIVLDTLATILKIYEESNHSSFIITNIFKIVIKCLTLNQSVIGTQSLLAFQRLLVKKHHKLLFEEVFDLSASLCECLLDLAGSNLKEIRSHAVASLYILMRYNYEYESSFARVKLQVTMALSRIVCDTSTINKDSKSQVPVRNFKSDDVALQVNLNRSLRTMVAYSSVDREIITTNTTMIQSSPSNTLLIDNHMEFVQQIRELADNLHNILTDTVNLRLLEMRSDPQMQLELMNRVARGYQNSPDLRLTWLQMMAKKNIELQHEAEAGMCVAHAASLVAEYLAMREPTPTMPRGCVSLAEALACPNLLEESAISDDTVGPEEDGVCCTREFSRDGLVRLVRLACCHWSRAHLFELVPRFLSTILPLLAERRDYRGLSRLHEIMRDSYDRISTQKRMFASYFRIGFYGTKFNELNGQEFIYKEAPFMKLPEISSKIEAFYQVRFGSDNIQIIKDSNIVKLSELDIKMMYIQITYVEPYFETTELSRRQTDFERNFNIRKFIFSTPYTLDGKAHGESVRDQYKRKTILITSNSFPYVKSRIRVVKKQYIDLDPIEVALEDLTKKVEQLTIALEQSPMDVKYLQMMLQGSIGTTVNQGPLELANSFLTENDIPSMGVHYTKLKLCFKEFLRKCREGLDCNKNLITPDQFEYQKELEKNYTSIHDQLMPLLNFIPYN